MQRPNPATFFRDGPSHGPFFRNRPAMRDRVLLAVTGSLVPPDQGLGVGGSSDGQ